MALARIAKGTAVANDDVNGVQTATVASVALGAGSTVVALVADDRGFEPDLVTWNGQALTLAVERGDAPGPYVGIWYRANVGAGTGDVVVHFPGATIPESIAIAVSEITGADLAPPDQTASAQGDGTTPASGATAPTAVPNEILIGAVATQGPSGDAAGTWSNGFSAGQRAGTTGGAASLKATIAEGYLIVGAVGPYAAAKTGITSRPWSAAIATFKELPVGGSENFEVTAFIGDHAVDTELGGKYNA